MTTENVVPVQEKLQNSESIVEILQCLFSYGLIGYLNFDLLNTCSDVVNELKPCIETYECEIKSFFTTTFPKMELSTFMSILKENPSLKPVCHVGFPTFYFIIRTTESVTDYSLHELLLKSDDFTWSKDVIIVDIKPGSIIVEFAVLPISAAAVIRDLTDERVLIVLKEKFGVDVKLTNTLEKKVTYIVIYKLYRSPHSYPFSLIHRYQSDYFEQFSRKV